MKNYSMSNWLEKPLKVFLLIAVLISSFNSTGSLLLRAEEFTVKNGVDEVIVGEEFTLDVLNIDGKVVEITLDESTEYIDDETLNLDNDSEAFDEQMSEQLDSIEKVSVVTEEGITTLVVQGKSSFTLKLRSNVVSDIDVNFVVYDSEGEELHYTHTVEIKESEGSGGLDVEQTPAEDDEVEKPKIPDVEVEEDTEKNTEKDIEKEVDKEVKKELEVEVPKPPKVDKPSKPKLDKDLPVYTGEVEDGSQWVDYPEGIYDGYISKWDDNELGFSYDALIESGFFGDVDETIKKYTNNTPQTRAKYDVDLSDRDLSIVSVMADGPDGAFLDRPGYRIRVNGQVAYCIEPFVLITSPGGYDERTIQPSDLTRSQRLYIAQIDYVLHQHIGNRQPTMAEHRAVQTMIWENLGAWTRGTRGYKASALAGVSEQGLSDYNYLAFRKILHEKLADMVKPVSFHDELVTLREGQSITLTDTGGNFKNYNEIPKFGDYATTSRSGNTLTITAKKVTPGTSPQSGMGRYEKREFDAPMMAYSKTGQQTIVTAGVEDPVGVRVYLKVDPAVGNIVVTKRDSQNSKLLPNTQYAMSYYNNVDGNGLLNKEIHNYTTNVDGVIRSNNWVMGTVYIQEKMSPYGYIHDKTVHKVTVKPGVDNPFTYTNTRQMGAIDLTKSDAGNGKLLAGVEYKVATGSNMSGVLQTKKTDSSGKLSFTGLELGTYYVQESTAIYGYVRDTTIHKVELTATNKTDSVFRKSLNLKNTRQMAELGVYKVDDDGANKALAGVEYSLSLNANMSSPLKVQKTGANGRLTFSGLEVGTYYLQETKAIYGYVRDTTIHKIDLTSKNDSTLVFKAQKDLSNRRQKAELSILKLDDDGTKTPLVGVEYSISKNADMRNPIKVQKTLAGGKLVFSDLEVDTYYVQETKSLVGWVRDTTIHKVDLTSKNDVTPIFKKHLDLENTRQKLVIRLTKYDNEVLDPSPFNILESTIEEVTDANKFKASHRNIHWGGKTWDMAGTEYIISQNADMSNPIDRQEIGSNQQLEFKDLELGTYYIQESKAIYGYVRDLTIHEVTVNSSDDTTYIYELKRDLYNQRQKADLIIEKYDKEKDDYGFVENERVTYDMAGTEFTLFKVKEGEVVENVYDLYDHQTGLWDTSKLEGVEVAWIGKDQKLTFRHVELGRYFVQETQPIYGYVRNDRIYEYNLDATNDRDPIFIYEDSVGNQRQLGRYVVSKFDEETTYGDEDDGFLIGDKPKDKHFDLSGAEFTIYQPKIGVTINDVSELYNEELGIWETDLLDAIAVSVVGDDQKAWFEFLEMGVHYIQETKAPYGYVRDTEIREFLIEADNELDTVFDFGIELTNLRQKFRINVDKKDADLSRLGIDDDFTLPPEIEGIPPIEDIDYNLAGTEYTLYKFKDDIVTGIDRFYDEELGVWSEELLDYLEVVAVRVIGEDQTLYFNNLELGRYFIQETEAIYGYIRDTGIYEVDGVADNDVDNEFSVDVLFYNERIKGEIELLKRDKDYPDLPLSKVPFQLYKAKDGVEIGNVKDLYDEELGWVTDDLDEVAVLETDVYGKLVFKQLELGKYYIQEVDSTYGYIHNDEIYEVDVFSENDFEPIVHFTISVENQKAHGKLIVNKHETEEFDGLGIKDVEYTIYENNTRMRIDDAESLWDEELGIYNTDILTEVATIVTDKKGIAEYVGLDFKDYFIMETDAPVGYNRDEKLYMFTVVQENKDDIEFITELDYTNERTEVEIDIHKFDVETKREIHEAGIEWLIWNVDTKEEFKLVSNELGKAKVNLTFGRYKAKEITPPEGYIVGNTLHEFEVVGDETESIRLEFYNFKIPKTGVGAQPTPNYGLWVGVMAVGLGSLVVLSKKKRYN